MPNRLTFREKQHRDTAKKIERAAALRDRGRSFAAIGDQLGVGPERARQLVNAAPKKPKQRAFKRRA